MSVIKDTLTRYQLSPDSCLDQCYDEASNTYGNLSGDVVQIQTLQSNFKGYSMGDHYFDEMLS